MLLKPRTRATIEIPLKDPPLEFNTEVVTCDERTVSIAAPTVGGKKVAVPEDTPILLSAPTRGGLTVMETAVASIQKEPVVAWVLPIPGIEKIRKIERRQKPRFGMDLHLPWSLDESIERRPPDLLKVVNMSTIGALVKLDQAIESLGELTIDMTSLASVSGETLDKKFLVRSTVVRSTGKGSFHGITFENLDRGKDSLLQSAIRRLKVEEV